jgi:dihydrofolate reductase
MNVTLDGFMSGPTGELDWHFPHWTEEMSMHANEQLSDTDTILLGRVTYQAMEKYWPSAPSDDFADKMNNYTKIVFSKTLEKTQWKNAIVVKGDLKEKVAKMKMLPGKNMIIYGSGSIVRTFAKLGLIDEYRIWIHPVAIESGIPLFKGIRNKVNLRLLKTRTFRSGVVIHYYETENNCLPA